MSKIRIIINDKYLKLTSFAVEKLRHLRMDNVNGIWKITLESSS